MDFDVNVNVANGVSFSSGGNARGSGLITWDGPDVTPTTAEEFNPVAGAYGKPNTFGLTGLGTEGGLDVTAAGVMNRIQINAHSDTSNIPVYVTFYRDSNNWATGVLTLSRGQYTVVNDPILATYEILFSAFTNTGTYSVADILRNTKAITLRIDGSSGADVLIDSFVAAGDYQPASEAVSTPDAGTLLTFGAALCALVRFRPATRPRA